MRVLRRLFCIALLGLTVAAATAAEPQAGIQYTVLPVPQPTDTAKDHGKSVEVIEFFAYYCPHCYAFKPLLTEWVKAQGDAIVFKRVHITRDAGVLPQQRLFYTLDAMNLLDAYDDKVFKAMHAQHLRLSSDEQVFDWAAQNGIDRAKFIDVYQSFGVQARLRRAGAMMEAYGVDRWPLIAIDGRYLTSPSHAGAGTGLDAGGTEVEQQQRALRIMDYLVAKAKADKQ
jgi:thiol:disulfide interchange protein DsbA